MKNTLLTSTAIALVSGGVASAADLPLKAAPQPVVYAPTWTGGYLGFHIGAGRNNWSGTQGATLGQQGFAGPCNYGQSCVSSKTGFLAGVDAGYDWQRGSAVFGVAADWTWTDLKSNMNGTLGGATTTNSAWSVQNKVDWLASFRGRMGLAVQDTMIYLTGGVAFGKVAYSHGVAFGGGTIGTYGNLSDTRIGWVAGGGVEHRLTRNWSFKAEALYYDLGKSDGGTITAGGASSTTSVSNEIIVGRVGMNYRF